MPISDRQRRQRRFYIRFTTNFVIFCLVAAPLQFHIQWYGNLTNSKPEWLGISLRSGPIYFYAIILCIEALLRLEHYNKSSTNEIKVFILRWLLLFPPFVFIMQYFVTPWYKSTMSSIPNIEKVVQILTGITAFVLSTVIHHLISKQEIKRIL